MKTLVTRFLLAAGIVSLACSGVLAAEPQLAHMVFFKVKDGSVDGKGKLVAGCHKYLSGHDGTVYYSAGVIADEMRREVNDRDFDVALHLVFENKAAHDKYQKDARHLKFIEENRDLWEGVRVFDSYLAPCPKNRKSAE
jgi:hypothetical protein